MEQYSPTFDPAEVPPSPRAMLQYEQNRRKETGKSCLLYIRCKHCKFKYNYDKRPFTKISHHFHTYG